MIYKGEWWGVKFVPENEEEREALCEVEALLGKNLSGRGYDFGKVGPGESPLGIEDDGSLVIHR